MPGFSGFFASGAVPYLVTFVYLQVLDYLTTIVALKIGMAEASPFIRWLMHGNQAQGLAESKLLALGLAAVCVFLDRVFLVRWINRWYAALIVWNLALMWIGAHPHC
jgi:hypothetical protein